MSDQPKLPPCHAGKPHQWIACCETCGERCDLEDEHRPVELLPALRAVRDGCADEAHDAAVDYAESQDLQHAYGSLAIRKRIRAIDDAALLELAGVTQEPVVPAGSPGVEPPAVDEAGASAMSRPEQTTAVTSVNSAAPASSYPPEIETSGHCGICGAPYKTIMWVEPARWVPQCACWKKAQAAEPAERPSRYDPGEREFEDKLVEIMKTAHKAKRLALLDAAQDLREWADSLKADYFAAWDRACKDVKLPDQARAIVWGMWPKAMAVQECADRLEARAKEMK